jgi:hypothetical protein
MQHFPETLHYFAQLSAVDSIVKEQRFPESLHYFAQFSAVDAILRESLM